MIFQKLYQCAFNLSQRNIGFAIQVVDGKTLISLPGVTEQIIVLEGHRIELVVSATNIIDAPILLDVTREMP